MSDSLAELSVVNPMCDIPIQTSEHHYSIDYLLNRAYDSFNLDKGKIKLVKPIFEKKNDRKCYVNNFTEICNAINRDPDDIRQYISKEIHMETSIKENGVLKIDGTAKNYNGETIARLIKNYIINFIMCKSCNSCKTTTKKIDRITYLICEVCRSKKAFDR